MGKNDLLIIAAVAAAAAYAVPKILGNKVDEAAKTDRTDIRQDAHTDRVEIRHDTIKEIVDKGTTTIRDIFSGGNSSSSSGSRSPTYDKVVVSQQPTTRTTSSSSSPFLRDAAGAANVSLASGGTGNAPAPTVSRYKVPSTPQPEEPSRTLSERLLNSKVAKVVSVSPVIRTGLSFLRKKLTSSR